MVDRGVWVPAFAGTTEGLPMTVADKLVLQRQHHLKWRSLDRLELMLMIICGVLCFGFSLSVTCDIVTRTIGRPWLWLQEVTSTLFIYAIFIGAAVATRRNDHLYLTAISEALHGTPRLVVEIIIRIVVLCVACGLIWFGYINFLRGFGSFRLPSGTPIASLYAAIPLAGALIALFTIEQLVNGIRNGFDHPEPPDQELAGPPADASVRSRARP
jgi:TRAP-type C4-dicarboxylate transport system permease small subunit